MNRDGIDALAEVKAGSSGCGLSAHPPSWWRVAVFRVAVLAVALGAAQGCYVYTPVVTARPVGTTLALDLNDRGRLVLGDLVGPSATRVEGVLRAEDDTVYVVNVSSVTYLHGQVAQWTGEALAVHKTHVASVREREFSRMRTALAAGGAAAAVVGFIASRDLLGSAPGAREPGVTDPPVDQ